MNRCLYVDTLWSSSPGVFDSPQSVREHQECFGLVFLLDHNSPWEPRNKFNYFLTLLCLSYFYVFSCDEVATSDRCPLF